MRGLTYLTVLGLLATGCDDTSDTDAGVATDAAMGTDAGDTDAGPGDMPVTLTFAARVGTEDFACGTTYPGLGTAATDVIGQDFRFYVSDVRLVTADGTEAPVTLEQDGIWQQANVALLDFEDGSGPCASGNAPMRSTVVGTVAPGTYTTVRFTLGIPFELNHGDVAAADPPLNISGMYWVWQGGHKFLRIDLGFDGGGGYNVHLGSTMCTSSGPMEAPTTECMRPNRGAVELTGFDPSSSVIVADLAALVADADLTTNTMDSPPGCQSFPSDETDCGPIFPRLGLDYATGAPGSTAQTFFSVE
ncbi:MAG: metallo-mystery pair system four-Cys motif protein [Myxococcales bacterium]|nr:metallo-mystery pair system four-Cys motif protein [Myxococcales bacterium]